MITAGKTARKIQRVNEKTEKQTMSKKVPLSSVAAKKMSVNVQQ